jgi:hypothetical protein
MNPEQIPELIARIALADPRVQRQDPAERRGQVEMWIGILAHVPYDFALSAAHAHYRASQWPILPADIAVRWTNAAADRLGRHTDPKPAIDPDQVTKWLRELGATRRAVAAGEIPPATQAIAAAMPVAVTELIAGIGWTPPTRSEAAPYLSDRARTVIAAVRRPRPAEWDIACPAPNCHAQPGSGCTRANGRPMKQSPSHPGRVDAYLARSTA